MARCNRAVHHMKRMHGILRLPSEYPAQQRFESKPKGDTQEFEQMKVMQDFLGIKVG